VCRVGLGRSAQCVVNPYYGGRTPGAATPKRSQPY
jgi:hypothetical protein